MTWSVTNFIIQIIAGIVGGHAAAAAVHDHQFGALGHTIAGAAGGAVIEAHWSTERVTLGLKTDVQLMALCVILEVSYFTNAIGD
jgi:hypothetical protein